MKFLAEGRAKQLRDHSNFPNAGVYDPPGVGGTGVIYVLHDTTHPELTAACRKIRTAVDCKTLERSAEVAWQRRHGWRIDRPLRALLAIRPQGTRGRGHHSGRIKIVSHPEQIIPQGTSSVTR